VLAGDGAVHGDSALDHAMDQVCSDLLLRVIVK
jgi:hypothetical protein